MRQSLSDTGKELLHNHLIENFNRYTLESVNDFITEATNSNLSNKDYYEENWLGFFGKLSDEARKCILIAEEVKIGTAKLQEDLQEICEQGLSELYNKLYQQEN